MVELKALAGLISHAHPGRNLRRTVNVGLALQSASREGVVV